MIKDEFLDIMEKRLQSHSQALDGVVGGMIKEFKCFKDERQKWSDDLQDDVRKTIQVTVNGKIDKISTSVQDIKEHLTKQDIVQGEIKFEISEVKEEQKRVQIELLKLNNETDGLKKETEPLIKFNTGISFFFKGLLWACGVIMATGGAWFVIIKFIE